MKHDLQFFLLLSVLCLTSICIQSTANGNFYREIQKQNNISIPQPDENGVFPDGSSLNDPETKALITVLQSMIPSNSVSEWEARHEGTFTAPINSNTEWGKSMFDEDTADLYELEHLEDIRRYNRNQFIGTFVVVIILCIGFLGLIITKSDKSNTL